MSIKILLADDSITIQKVVGIIFGGEDYALTVVDNGKAAVEKAQEINPDVLLIDALMPGMSGYEVCEAVRANPALAAKPILLLTGSFEPFDETKAKNCGADDFLAKPFESQQIVAKVKELFDLGTTRAAVSAPVAAPAETEPVTPAFVQFDAEPVAAPFVDEPAAPNDIWGAFTAAEASAVPAVETLTAADKDVFGMVAEETVAQVAAVETSELPASESIGSQWIPVAEETFEFEEEPAVEAPTPAYHEPEPFGADNTFEVPAALEPAVPALNESVASSFAEPVEETAAPSAMTEDQLRAALTGASKEVIERIVWEVVPDLAEILIKEAIRKIRDGL